MAKADLGSETKTGRMFQPLINIKKGGHEIKKS